MLIAPSVLKSLFGVRPSGVLHVGGHLAEEHTEYKEQGFGRVIWVEAQESLARAIEQRMKGTDHIVLTGVAWSVSGLKLDFNLANNGQSSSLYEPDLHVEHYPNIEFTSVVDVTSIRLDQLVPSHEKFDFLNLDVQGAELEALKGLGSMLGNVKWVYSEVNRANVYREIPMIGEMDLFLKTAGFLRVCTVWTGAGWGDALYVRRENGLVDARLRLVGTAWAAKYRLRRLPKLILRQVRRRLLDPVYSRAQRMLVRGGDANEGNGEPL